MVGLLVQAPSTELGFGDQQTVFMGWLLVCVLINWIQPKTEFAPGVRESSLAMHLIPKFREPNDSNPSIY